TIRCSSFATSASKAWLSGAFTSGVVMSGVVMARSGSGLKFGAEMAGSPPKFKCRALPLPQAEERTHTRPLTGAWLFRLCPEEKPRGRGPDPVGTIHWRELL